VLVALAGTLISVLTLATKALILVYGFVAVFHVKVAFATANGTVFVTLYRPIFIAEATGII